MKVFTAAKLLFKTLTRAPDADRASFVLAQRLAKYWNPRAIVGEYGKTWLQDSSFADYYEQFEPANPASAERKFFLGSLLSLVEALPGDTVECGVYKGASSWLICDRFKQTEKLHFMFDSFEGVSRPLSLDGEHWREGDLCADETVVRRHLNGFPNARICKGWIPAAFDVVSTRAFCFVHIDVDLYQPTLDSIRFFYPRLVPGGIILSDDYGFSTCPGARKAFDEFMSEKPEKIIQVPTGQAFIVRDGTSRDGC